MLTRGLYDLTELESSEWLPLVRTVAGLAEFSRQEIRQRFSDDLPAVIRAQAIVPGATQEIYFGSILTPCINDATGWGLFLWLDWIYRSAVCDASRAALRASVNRIESRVKKFRLEEQRADFFLTSMSYVEQCEAVYKLAMQSGEDLERIREAFYATCHGVTAEEQRVLTALHNILAPRDTAGLWPSPSRAAVHALNYCGLPDAGNRLAEMLHWLQSGITPRSVPCFLVFTVEQTATGGAASFTYSGYCVPGTAPSERHLLETYLKSSNSGTWEGFRTFVSTMVELIAGFLPMESRKDLRIEIFLKDDLLDQLPDLFLGGYAPKLLAAEYCVAIRPWQRGEDPMSLWSLEERYRAISDADSEPPRRVRVLNDIPIREADLLPTGDTAELVFLKKRPKPWQVPTLMRLNDKVGLPYLVWPQFELGEDPPDEIFALLFQAPRVHDFCEAMREIRKTYGARYKVTMIADSPYRWPQTGRPHAETSFSLPF